MIKYCPFIFLFFIFSSIHGQSGCYNSDFSTGDFTGWRASYGPRSQPDLNKEFSPEHHKIMMTGDDLYDPYAAACEGPLEMIPPGEMYSARLGNDKGGSEAEQLIYDIDVSEDNNLFIYKYAVVLQDGGHEKSVQPNFSVRILNQQGAVIDPLCGVYNVSAAEPYQNGIQCRDVYWTQWNTVGINLANYVGQKVSIEFTTRDCGFQEHFGYAYISAKCSKLKINVGVCVGGNNFALTAPLGFVSYVWSYQGQVIGTPTQSITLPLADYPPGAIFECVLTSFNNGNKCESTIQAILSSPTIITPDFAISIPCKVDYNNFSPITFLDKTTVLNGVINKWEWNFGDGKTSLQQNPSHIFENSGDYTISLKTYSETGCSDFISKPIHIENNPIVKPAVPETQTFCSYPIPTIANLDTNGLTLKWFDSLLSTNALSETTVITNRDLYCAILKDGCLGPRTKVTTMVNSVTPPTGDTTQFFCLRDNPVIADLAVKESSVLWFSTQDGVTPISTSTPLKNNTIYYASKRDEAKGCSSSRLAITAILKESPAALAPDFTQEFCSNQDFTLRNLKLYSPTVKYYSNLNTTTTLAHTTALENETTYYAGYVDPDTKCESDVRTAISVKIVPCDITIFNLITIDNNTQNDHLEIENIEYFPDNAIQIYNRFGQLVYKMNGYGLDNNYFYGKANAGEVFLKDEKLPTGSYFYIINYKKKDLTDGTKKGFLYIHNNG